MKQASQHKYVFTPQAEKCYLTKTPIPQNLPMPPSLTGSKTRQGGRQVGVGL